MMKTDQEISYCAYAYGAYMLSLIWSSFNSSRKKENQKAPKN